MADTESETGRAAQRRRTRHAIVAATAKLLAEGRTPSVAEVAEAADVSRRTVYMYFPTLEQLVVDASLLSIARRTVDVALDAVDAEPDVERRVEALVRAVQPLFASTEQQGRTLMRITAGGGGGGGHAGDARDASASRPPRGYRRVEWIERALAPARATLKPARFERLVSALAMVIGWEAVIVARDVRGLSLAEAEEVSVWSARALVRAALEESGPAAPTSRAQRAKAPTRAKRSR
jgi:AcrR family transcriptional regulator